MARQRAKSLALAGLLASLGPTVGCNDRHDRNVRDGAREVGQEVGKAARQVRETTHQAVEGFKEGVGGSGTGDKPEVLHDSERPLQEHPSR
jgi:hypothetical protein